jgi:DNA-binding response OmpR family regulator
MRELIARIHALLRRGRSSTPRALPPTVTPIIRTEVGTLDMADLRIDLDRREVIKEGDVITLSRKEFDLLAFLAGNRGRVFDRQTLLSRVWGEDCYVDDRTVDVHIRWLREKLERRPAKPEILITVRGVGYKYRG